MFLGGYINVINAQNLNCRSLVEHLDKDKFEVFTMSLHSGTLLDIDGVRVVRCFRPYKLFAVLAYLWGIWHADVAYLPKAELTKWNRFLTRFFSKKSIITMEGIFTGANLEKMTDYFGNASLIREYYNGFSNCYSITKRIKKYHEAQFGIKSHDEILPLGVELASFKPLVKKKLESVIIIGGDLTHKGYEDYLALAKLFPELSFHVVGIPPLTNKETGKNLIFHQKLNHHQLNKLFDSVQLHILPSRAEGFPKVVLETAAAGIPSLLYSDYGANEWITNGIDGFVLDTIDDMQEKLKELQLHPDVLQKTSDNVVKLAEQFSWNRVVKRWEKAFEEVVGA